MDHILTLIRFDVFHSAFWAAVIAATAPNVNPFFAVIRAPIVIDELLLRHFFTSDHHSENYLARGRP
jgi:hypothetical protein